jgi:hypothetical protein
MNYDWDLLLLTNVNVFLRGNLDDKVSLPGKILAVSSSSDGELNLVVLETDTNIWFINGFTVEAIISEKPKGETQ